MVVMLLQGAIVEAKMGEDGGRVEEGCASAAAQFLTSAQGPLALIL